MGRKGVIGAIVALLAAGAALAAESLAPAPAQAAPVDRDALVRALVERSRLLEKTEFEVPLNLWKRYIRDTVTGEPFPVATIVAEARYVVSLPAAPADVSLKVTLKLQAIAPDPAASLPLLSGRLVWKNIKLNDLPAKPSASGGWLCFNFQQPGNYVLTAEADLRREEIVDSVETLDIPKSVLTILRFESPGAWQITPEGDVRRIRGDASGTAGEIAFAPRTKLAFSCRRPEIVTDRPPKFQLAGDVAWNLDTATQDFSANVEVAIVGGLTDRLELSLPADASRVSVTGPDVRETRLAAGTATVFLRGRITGKTALNIAWERPRSKGGAERFDAFTLKDGRWASGTLVVTSTAGESEVLAASASGLREKALAEIPPSASTMLMGPPSLAYDITADWSAGVELLSLAEFTLTESIADLAHYEVAVRPDGSMMGKVTYEVRNRHRQFLRLTLPKDSQVLLSRVNEEARHVVAVPGEADVYFLPLVRSKASVEGLVSFPVEVVFLAKVRAPGPVGGAVRLPLPKIDLPIAYAWCEAWMPESAEVLKWSGPLRRVDKFSSETAASTLDYGSSELAEGYRKRIADLAEKAPELKMTAMESLVPELPAIHAEKAAIPQDLYARARLAKNYYRAGKDYYDSNDYENAESNLRKAAELAPEAVEGANAKRLLSNIKLAKGELELKGKEQQAAGAQVLGDLKQQREQVTMSQEKLVQEGFQSLREGNKSLAYQKLAAAENLSQSIAEKGESSREQSARMSKARDVLKKISGEQESQAQALNEEAKKLAGEGRFDEAIRRSEEIAKIAPEFESSARGNIMALKVQSARKANVHALAIQGETVTEGDRLYETARYRYKKILDGGVTGALGAAPAPDSPRGPQGDRLAGAAQAPAQTNRWDPTRAHSREQDLEKAVGDTGGEVIVNGAMSLGQKYKLALGLYERGDFAGAKAMLSDVKQTVDRENLQLNPFTRQEIDRRLAQIDGKLGGKDTQVAAPIKDMKEEGVVYERPVERGGTSALGRPPAPDISRAPQGDRLAGAAPAAKVSRQGKPNKPPDLLKESQEELVGATPEIVDDIEAWSAQPGGAAPDSGTGEKLRTQNAAGQMEKHLSEMKIEQTRLKGRLTEQFDTFYKRGQYDDALVVLERMKALDPEDAAIVEKIRLTTTKKLQAWRYSGKTTRLIEEEMHYSEAHEQMTPWYPITKHPDNWKDLADRRLGGAQKYAEASPANRKVLQRLDETIVSFTFNEQPLPEALDFLQTLGKVNIVIDRSKLKPDATVSLKLDNVPLEVAIRLLTEQIGLKYVVRDGVVFISDAEGVGPFLPVPETLTAADRWVMQGLDATRVSFTFNEQPAHEAIDFLAILGKTPVLFDMRKLIDSGAKVTLKLDDVPLSTALRLTARQLRLPFGVRSGKVVVGDLALADPPPKAPVKLKKQSIDELMEEQRKAPEPGDGDWVRGAVGSGGGGGSTLSGMSWSGHVSALKQASFEVVFCFDSTGPMRSSMAECQQRIRRLMKAITYLVPNAKIGLVTYRDWKKYGPGTDFEYLVKILPVQKCNKEGLEKLERFLGETDAFGGSGYASAVQAGLESAIDKTGWSTGAKRMIFLLGATPPHAEDDGLRLTYDLCRKWKESGGVLSCVDARGGEKVMEEFKRMAAEGGGEAMLLADEHAMVKPLVITIFGSKWEKELDGVLTKALPPEESTPAPKIETRTYDVRDLMTDIPNFEGPNFELQDLAANKAAAPQAHESKSAEEMGRGVTNYFVSILRDEKDQPLDPNAVRMRAGSLVVTQSPETQAKVEKLLDELRKAKQPQVEMGKRITEQRAKGLIRDQSSNSLPGFDDFTNGTASVVHNDGHVNGAFRPGWRRDGATTSAAAPGNEDLKRFIDANYNWRNALPQSNGVADVQDAIPNSGALSDAMLLENLKRNWEQKVPVSSLNLNADAARAKRLGVQFVNGHNGLNYALVDEAQFRTLKEFSDSNGAAPAVETNPSNQDTIVGTPARLVNGMLANVRWSGDRDNKLDILGNDITVGHPQYVIIDNGRYLTALRADVMRHWTEATQPMFFASVPQEIDVPRAGQAVKFEKTLIEPTDDLVIQCEILWKGGVP